MAQKTDAQLTTEANIIRDETAIGANTALRVGIMLDNLIDSKTNNDIISDAPLGTSTSIVPTQNAVKTYADGLVVGLLDDRGNFDASTVGSPYPSLNGSGTGSIIQKGDIYFISVAGTVGATSVAVGASVRALVDTPAQTPTNWDVLDAGVGVVFEPAANKSDATNLGGVSPSHTLFPTQYAVKSYVDGTITPTPNLQAVLAAGHNLANGRNFQGTGAGGSNLGFNVNAFGTNSAVGNSGSNINSFGTDASTNNTGTEINALGTGAAYDNAGNYVNALGYVAAKNNTGVSVNALGYTAGYNNTFSSVNIFGFAASATADSQLAMTGEDGYHARISYSGLTDNRLYQLPDASGTIALTDDITTFTRHFSIGNSELLTIGATPINLFPSGAIPSGKILIPVSVSIKYNYGTTSFTSNTALSISYWVGTGSITMMNTNILSYGSTYYELQNISNIAIPIGVGFDGGNIRVSNPTFANPIGGDGFIEVFVTYSIKDL